MNRIRVLWIRDVGSEDRRVWGHVCPWPHRDQVGQKSETVWSRSGGTLLSARAGG